MRFTKLPQNIPFLTNSSATLFMEKFTPLIFVMSVQFIVKIFTVWFPYLGKVLLATEEVSEDEVQYACQQEWAEERSEKAEGGILVVVFQVGYGQVPD